MHMSKVSIRDVAALAGTDDHAQFQRSRGMKQYEE